MAPTSLQAVPDAPPDELRRVKSAILVVDVVDSVRLMLADEGAVITHWRRFVREVREVVLPAHGGTMVKSLGDGLLLRFEAVPAALRCAFALHRCMSRVGEGAPAHGALRLRAGLHHAAIVVDALDVYGAGVNLAARLVSLARPGETVVSAEARSHIAAPGLARVEAMGDCWLRHYSEPVAAWRCLPPLPPLPPVTRAVDDAPPDALLAV